MIECHNDGMSFRAISRRIKVSHTTIIRWIRECGSLPIDVQNNCRTVEIDELQFFVGHKKKRQFLWIAVCRETMQILSVKAGRRTKKCFELMQGELENISIRNYCTDGYQVYNILLPKNSHKTGKRHTYTIEMMMSLVRHYLARFRRKTRCYSKSLEMAEASARLFAMHWNSKLQKQNNTLGFG